ncbi:MAG: aminotransferase class III-fold pyridoxal phosphate-dependent enzyme [Gemmatimonas sp.]
MIDKPDNSDEDDDDFSEDWRSRAEEVVPGGSSTGSKRAAALYGSEAHDNRLPTHFDRAIGCSLHTADGKRLIDCSMALGAVAIGYADPEVTRAVLSAAAQGNVAGLPHTLEVEVAERLAEMIPCAEQVRFLRTGAEANAAAVRIARTYTDRTHIIACGYFGWLDWCSDAAGVPAYVKADITWVPFNDIGALADAFGRVGTQAAALIIEPLVETLANREWLLRARALCDQHGVLLIFDEVKTAFRVRTGGVQELFGVVPDVCTLGKALANGYPLSAVVGRTAVMSAAMQTWISSTAAAESTGLAAANAVLDWHERVDVPERLEEIGGAMKAAVTRALSAVPALQVRAEGEPTMWRLMADNPNDLDALVANATRHGVLLKRGAYQFASLAHDDEAMTIIHDGVLAAARDTVA